MASGSPDPYEQQLLAVFESCSDGMEGLDAKGLARLCEKLQLEDQAPKLLEQLLGRQKETPITFPRFRDALLSLLGAHSDEFDGSPEREVRPKFVFGKKKYGRRSRPENSQSSDSDSDGVDETEEQPPRDGEILFKRRKKGVSTSSDQSGTSTGIPGAPRAHTKSTILWGKGLTDEEESVRSTWEQLGAAHEGYLGREELRLVCKAAGLEGAADELVERLFERLGVEQEGRVSFEQFLNLFRSGLAEDALVSSPRSRGVSFPQEQQPHSLTFHEGTDDNNKAPISLDTYTSGLVSPDQLLVLWEAGGVPGAARLLHDLGFGVPAHRPICLAELATALEEEARALTEEAVPPEQPLTCVLHASLVTQQAETKCLKAALEQVLGERDKLRQDVTEANERAALLAQEVDDRHARLEQASQQQARLQEQRHNEEVRALQAQLTMDREQLAALTTGLELRLGQMQAEESRLRTEVATLTRRCESLDKENCSLREQLSESEQLKSQLQWKVETMQQLELRLAELESEQSEIHARTVLPLQERMEALTAENTSLRDANDELTLKLEELSAPHSTKKSPGFDEMTVVSPRGNGKRRGRPGGPSSEESSDEDSPRLGKLRRRGPSEGEETERLQTRVAELEMQLALCRQQAAAASSLEHVRGGIGTSDGVLGVVAALTRASECAQHVQGFSQVAECRHDEQLKPPFLKNLKQVFESLRAQVHQEVQEEHQVEVNALKVRCEDLTQLQKTIEAEFEMKLHQMKQEKDSEVLSLQKSLQLLQDRIETKDTDVIDSSSDSSPGQLKAEIDRLLSAKVAFYKEKCSLRETLSDHSSKPTEQGDQVLRDRVAELEGSLELMREEYERCEDYWQGKLEDERRLYEQEQAATDERFSELEMKIREYEELLCQEQNSATTNNGRLSPIAESFALEKQVTDLEDECEGLHMQLSSLSLEFERLQQRLVEAEFRHERTDVAVQTEYKSRSISLLSGFSVKEKNTQVNQSSFEELDGRPKMLNGDLKRSPPDLLRSGVSAVPREQSCRVQLNVMQALSSRLQQQEQRCRRLEAQLAQQQLQTERHMHQHSSEVANLQTALKTAQAHIQQSALAFEEQAQKLTSSDLLVKELYVENALLHATIERLERRCLQLAAAQQAAPGSA